MRWKLISENWTLPTLTHTALSYYAKYLFVQRDKAEGGLTRSGQKINTYTYTQKYFMARHNKCFHAGGEANIQMITHYEREGLNMLKTNIIIY